MANDVLETPGGRLLVSVAAGVAGLAGSYAVTGYAPTFVASPVERALARSMPGIVVSYAITYLGSLGQRLNLVTALVIVVAFIALAARASLLTGATTNNRLVPLVGTAVLTWLVAFALTNEPVLSAGPAVAAAAIVGLAQLLDGASDRLTPVSETRRRVLTTIGAALGVSALGYALGNRRPATAFGADAPTLEAPGADLTDAQRQLATADTNSFRIDGLEPLVSDRFYEVDINSINPTIDADEWSLSITGAVEEEVTLTYDDILEMDAENRFSTLRCVGEALNGRKMDNALWTGVPVDPLLDQAGVRSDCECVMLRADDGYFEEFPLPALRGGLLAYGMNGAVLPRGHGYPVRALVPGHWGEVNVKWLTEIELLEREADGYWENRGWHGTGPVKPIAKLHYDAELGNGRRRLAGHAYAGLRGVSRVEVSTDDGETWAEATLSDPLPGEDVWRQWQYTYERPGRPHTVVVRMVDDDGTVQTDEPANPFPSGPSGWVSKRFSG